MATPLERRQRVYEQLGAPLLLHRNSEYYCSEFPPNVLLQTTSLTAVESFRNDRERLSRTQTRWFYPVQDPTAQALRVPEQEVDQAISSSSRRGRGNLTDQDLSSISISTIPKQCIVTEKVSSTRKLARSQIFERFRHDTTYMPARKVGRRQQRKERGLIGQQLQQSWACDEDRLNRGHPAYMAPFGNRILDGNLTQRHSHHSGVYTKDQRYEKRVQPMVRYPRRLKNLTYGADHINAPTKYGNSLVSLPCWCPGCEMKGSICLLHPVGALMDRVRLSFLYLPQRQGSPNWENEREWTDSPLELPVGDTVRQMLQCGTRVFFIRTDLHCTLFQVKLAPHPKEGLRDSGCWGWGSIQQLHRLDLRSLNAGIPSFRPLHATCHPKYGYNFTKPNIAIITRRSSNSSRVDDLNYIHHFQHTPTSIHLSEHRVPNLQEMSEIEFTTTHPMVLWVAGRSHVRPGFKRTTDYKMPRLGNGRSLFSVDLRVNQAMFCWSPSHDEHLVEGAHSISGLYVDRLLENSVWIASFSAGKTWEIDSRMPCEPVNIWSLGHSCDQLGVTLPATGYHGAGHIFSQPVEYKSVARPVLCVSKSPEAFGLHIYQRPDVLPKFHLESIECVAEPSWLKIDGASVKFTSVFRLPDVSDSSFTVGLTTFRVPVRSFMDTPSLIRTGLLEDDVDSILCATTMTNRGDLYMHALLESKAEHRVSKYFPDMPSGSTMVPVPETSPATQASNGNHHYRVPLQLCNQYPLPGHAFFPPRLDSSTRTAVIEFPTRVMDEDEYLSKDASSIFGIKTIPKVVRKTMGESRIQVPSQWIENSKSAIRHARSGFDYPVSSKVEDANPEVPRSDVTAEIIAKAVNMWADKNDDDDYDSSSSSSPATLPVSNDHDGGS